MRRATLVMIKLVVTSISLSPTRVGYPVSPLGTLELRVFGMPRCGPWACTNRGPAWKGLVWCTADRPTMGQFPARTFQVKVTCVVCAHFDMTTLLKTQQTTKAKLLQHRCCEHDSCRSRRAHLGPILNCCVEASKTRTRRSIHLEYHQALTTVWSWEAQDPCVF